MNQKTAYVIGPWLGFRGVLSRPLRLLQAEAGDRDQGDPRAHRPRLEGGEGPGRGRALDRQGGRVQGRLRDDEESEERRVGKERRVRRAAEDGERTKGSTRGHHVR